jgi:hypothetical protein
MRQIIFLAFAASIAATGAATAGPRSIDDCEKIEAADAYNHCLASFGPVASGHARAFAPLSAATAEPHAGRRSRGLSVERRRAAGRLRMVITPGGGRD